MKARFQKLALLALALVWGSAPSALAAEEGNLMEEELDTSFYAAKYLEVCAVCHGENMTGTAMGAALINADLKYGNEYTDVVRAIESGFPTAGMPAWSATLTEDDIRNLALYITETRTDLNYADFRYDATFTLPEGEIETELHTFTLEPIIEDIDPLPFSIAPMPDGNFLLVEKKVGLSIVSADGVQSEYISGTPKTYDDTYILSVKQEWGTGWMLEAALHPNYQKNGWIYLQYGDRCEDCNEMSRAGTRPVSMNKLVRGRIKDGAWVDEEVIWQTDLRFYGSAPDLAGGGRIAFDQNNHVFISVGMKGFDNHTGIQNLATPWGKTHRVNDDGTIPPDNPFMRTEGAIKTIWTYGHRSPQGLEVRKATGELWGTEHGPRGGDEVNLLLPGKNYGWPLTSKGMNYTGTPVDYGKKLGIEFDLKDIEQPVVDLTPSPAVSSFVFYDGDAFPGWRGDLIVGSLKAQSLYRIRLEGNKAVHKETLISGLARIRDVEVGLQGELLLLLENNEGSKIVSMHPAQKGEKRRDARSKDAKAKAKTKAMDGADTARPVRL